MQVPQRIAEQERRQLLLLKDEFINDVAEFRHKHSIPEGGSGGRGELQYYEELMDHEAQLSSEMARDVRRLSEKYAIFDISGDRGLEPFLVTGDEAAFLNTFRKPILGVTFASRSNRGSGNRLQAINLHIYNDTRQEEIIKLWPQIKAMQKIMPGSKKLSSVPSGITNQHIEIYKRRKAGEASKDIGYDLGLSYKDIDDIYNHLKEKIRRV